ncbi:GNAT family N-acetyltransferase [Fulvivirgaceae bacterium BMA12]|uniref:GNAT family N-acetyltransferase n=1 Tax=Agaribacillus aureus TaxID=3051825 RepID=A0ABT8LD11_9BACT|nr:GNAT family N-acetyltransferase [Fulvivirgaceae bacterium BMA12]
MVEIVDPRAIPDWNERMLEFEGYSIFYSSNWAQVLCEAYGYKPLYFTLTEGNKFVGVLPVLEVDSFITGRRGVSLPFTDTCEPLVRDEKVFESLLEAVRTHAKKNRWKYIEVRGGDRFFGDDTTPSSVFYEHRLPVVAAKSEEWLKKLQGATRRNINRSVREGITSETSQSLEAIEAFYNLNCLTRKRHGLPPQPLNFFRKLHELIIQKDLGFVVNACFEGEVVASGVFLHFGDHIIYKYGASDFNYKKKRHNYAMFWQAMDSAYEKGLKNMSLGKTTTNNDGLRRFKLAWGAEEREVGYYKYSIKENQYVESHDQVEGFHNSIFRNMPNPLLKLAGNLAYKHIA